MHCQIPEPRLEPLPAEAVKTCADCGAPIYLGGYYYALGGESYCEYCVEEALRIAEEV